MPSRTLSAKGERVLRDLPPWYGADETARTIVDVMARELQRIEDFAGALGQQMHPQLADDTYGILGLWESLFRLPVEPVGVSLAARRALIQAHLKKRNSGAGSDWEDSVSLALNTTQWTYEEGPGDYEITVLFPYVPGGYTTTQALLLLRDITPAHLDLSVGYSQGWIVAVALIGVDPL